jgi:group II intron reverse transcriptase/maturase
MEGNGRGPYGVLETSGIQGLWDHPTRREVQGDGAAILLSERERRSHGEGRQVSRNPHSEVREMRSADPIVGSIHERGKPGLPRDDVYRQRYTPQLFLHAYGHIYRNVGAMTPGVTPETVDGMSLAKIDSIMNDLRYERYRGKPARRVYIAQKNSMKKRPLGGPTGSDKRLQEVIRLMLEAYDEPPFSPRSHGFRPNRGCHTALREVDHVWGGTKWFIAGDIAQCFDRLDHLVLMSILREQIRDHRCRRLIENLLHAGYLEAWKFTATVSGSPPGAVLSPMLSNIYLTKLEEFVEQILIPQYPHGDRRRTNPTWVRLSTAAQRRSLTGAHREACRMRRQMPQVPSLDPPDQHYRRLRYVRYADDWLVGFSGPRREAEAIKRELGTFLRAPLKLELSETKTLITHARTHAARFLGYDIVVLNNNQQLDRRGHRRSNGQIGLSVPKEVSQQTCPRDLGHGKPRHRAGLIHDTPFSRVAQYQQE